MGDRANVVVLDEGSDNAVFLYTHWSGTVLPSLLKRALDRKQRWDDGAYLTRIIFCEMVKGYESDETGFGISAHICDNEHPLLVVDVGRQVVVEMAEDVFREHGIQWARNMPGRSFATFDGEYHTEA